MKPEWFQEMEVNLKTVSEKTKWKEPMSDALAALQMRIDKGDSTQAEPSQNNMGFEKPWIITIPPPKPKVTPKATPPPQKDDGQKIEIIVRPKP